MALIPLQLIIDALGDTIPANATIRQVASQITVDKQALVDALNSKGSTSYITEPLSELIDRVALLIVNFQLEVSDLFPPNYITLSFFDAVVTTVGTGDIVPMQEDFSDFSWIDGFFSDEITDVQLV